MQLGQIPELMTDEGEARLDVIATDRFQGSYNPVEGVASALKSRKATGKGAVVGADTLPLKYWLQLEKATPGIEWVFEDDLIRDVRLIKSPRELALFEAAGALVTGAETAVTQPQMAGQAHAK